MSDKRYLGNIITQNPTAPAGDLANSAAKGVWSLEEQLAYQKAGLWPVPGNFPPDVEDVFSTYLYTGTGSTQTITNGIDLDGEGGLTWIKVRSQAQQHALFDTERGATKYLKSSSTGAETTRTDTLTSFNSNGFSLGNDSSGALVNTSGQDYASWTFRKAPKFFDVLTYTGTGSHPRNVSHNLGSVPGMILVKNLGDGTEDWIVYHRGVDSSAPEDYGMFLNLTDSRVNNDAYWGDTAPTSTTFTVGGNITNQSGENFIAYLFAHNDGDGGFGADGDADIIKCGIFPWGSTSGTEVNLGFEPQWILFKAADQAGKNWFIFDAMRGIVTGGLSGDGDAALFPNKTGAENVNTWGVDLTPTGFIAYGNNIASSGNIIYMAIRRGTKVPESGTEVFDISTATNTYDYQFQSNFPVDMALKRENNTISDPHIGSRLTGATRARTDSTDPFYAEAAWTWDYMDGYWTQAGSTNSNLYSWMWKRAPGYFDAVAEPIASAQMSGPASSSYNPAHNLGVTPEMIWVKDRDNTDNWYVYHSALGTSKKLILNSSAAESSSSWAVASDNFNFYSFGNATGNAICYLFASLPGISKVGSVSHTSGSATNVDCGFTAGARFILLKVTDSGGNWFFYDTARGIVAGADARLKLNSNAAENTSDDIDPLSSGFTITSTVSTGNYIFYAIA